ncbi:DUF2804 domain-containing protein [Catenulispora rubra]|uniref:DUF2804 domain-containing protein n=1 Tax=Catenulispora rubra TaxID=280293 RepID=UPI0018920340|nr:DUF2804 domain-containing protein [Catenulispora rubra]
MAADHDRLVVAGTRRYGRLPNRPAVVDPLAEYQGLARAHRRLRLKEWVGFTLLHPEIYSSLILQDAHYLASSEIYVYDRDSARLHQHAANALGGSLNLPHNLMDNSCAIAQRGYRIAYDFSEQTGRHRIKVDIAASGQAPAIVADLTLDATASSAPLSVSSHLPGGKMYTHKALYPVSGTLRFGDTTVTFFPERDLAILDEHRSLLPYRTRWVWGTFALPTADGPVGANFVNRREIIGQPEESCLWTPDSCEALSNVSFTKQAGDSTAPWRIASADGRLDVVFTPEGRKTVKHQLGVLAIDYFQMFGSYTGTLRTGCGASGGNGTDDSTIVEVKDVHGVCESMDARM